MSPEPLVVVSSDTHIGPLVEEQLHDYCPSEYRDDFDAFVAAHKEAAAGRGLAGFGGHPNSRRRAPRRRPAPRDMNRDGIAAEVIFHGSQNGEPMPFLPQLLGNNPSFELIRYWPRSASASTTAGWAISARSSPNATWVWHTYRCGTSTPRYAAEWAAEAGLRGVNFPAPRHGVYLEYNDRAWEPFWSACEACDMALATHVGSPARPRSGPETLALTSIEDGGYFARPRDLVDDLRRRVRTPPQPQVGDHRVAGEWWSHTMVEADSTWLSQAEWNAALREQVPRRPSEYCESNVFVGASFLAPFEAARAVEEGYASQLLWGSDYPHIEGTWQYAADDDVEPITRVAQRNTFCEIPADATRAMLGENAVRVYGLDARELADVAARIAAPTLEDLAVPIESVPVARARRPSVRTVPGSDSVAEGDVMDDRAQVLADKAEIVELMTRYCFAVDFATSTAPRGVHHRRRGHLCTFATQSRPRRRAPLRRRRHRRMAELSARKPR